MSKRTNTKTVTLTTDALEALIASAVRTAVAEVMTPTADERAHLGAKAEREEESEFVFVEWIRDTAEARQARKGANAELSAWLKGKGLPIGGEVWAKAKAGERRMNVLKAAAKRDAKARAAKA